MVDVSLLGLDEQLCFALYAASRAITGCYRPLLDELELTYPQFLVMLVVWELEPTAVSVGELGTRLKLDSGTLSPLLKRLEAAGFVTRERSTVDERVVVVAATPAGSALRERAESVPHAMRATIGLPAADLAALRETLHDLASRVAATRAGEGVPRSLRE